MITCVEWWAPQPKHGRVARPAIWGNVVMVTSDSGETLPRLLGSTLLRAELGAAGPQRRDERFKRQGYTDPSLRRVSPILDSSPGA